jgi:hypothetical protein
MSDATASSLELLRETFEGGNGPSTQFLDNGPESGFFGVIGGLTAAQASRPTRPGGATIAGHVHHVGFGLEVSEAWMRGDRESRDWSQSWTVKSVDDASWKRLLETFRRRYEAFNRTVAASNGMDAGSLANVMGAIAHSAYHLGALKQVLAAARG